MLDPNLKQEWLEKVAIEKKQYIDQYDMSLRKIQVCTDYYYAPEEVKNDRDIALAALLQGNEILSIMPKELKNDKEFILTLLKNNYKSHIHNHLGSNIIDDPELFELCLNKGELKDIYHIPYMIKENRDLIVKLLPKYNLYRHIEDQYKLDTEIVALDLLHHHPGSYHRAYKSVQNKLSKDKKFVTSFLQKNPEFYSTMTISEKLKLDLDIIDIGLSHDPTLIEFIPAQLLSDKAFMTHALPKYKCPLSYCTEELREDYDLVKLHVTNNGENLKNSQKWRNNADLAEIALQTYHDINLLTPSLIKNKDLVIKFLNADKENCAKLFKMTNDYSQDIDIANIFNHYEPSYLCWFKLGKEYDHLYKAAAQKSKNIELLSNEQLKDRDLVFSIVKEDVRNIPKLIDRDKTYRDDYDIVKLGLNYKIQLLTDSPILRANKELVMYAMSEYNFNSPELIDPELLLDKEISLLFIKKDVRNYTKLPLSIKNNPEIYDQVIRFLDPKHTFDQWARVNSTFTSATNLKDLYSLIVDNSSLANDYNFHLSLLKINPFFYDILGNDNALISDKKILHTYCQSLEKYNTQHNTTYIPQISDVTLAEYDFEPNSANDFKKYLDSYFLTELLNTKIPFKNVSPAVHKNKI